MWKPPQSAPNSRALHTGLSQPVPFLPPYHEREVLSASLSFLEHIYFSISPGADAKYSVTAQ